MEIGVSMGLKLNKSISSGLFYPTILLIVIGLSLLSTGLYSINHIVRIPTSDVSDDELLMDYARIAWRYFQPGVGVNPSTGLHYAKLTWHAFTDWDLAGYIMAILDAGDLGLISIGGEWGVKDRLDKIMDFLANRKLYNGIPYWSYNADTGEPKSKKLTNPSDAGRLLIALYLVKSKYPEYAEIIDYIVYEKTAYDKIASDSSLNWGGGFYLYYIAHGFKLFGFDDYEPVKRGLNELNRLMNGSFTEIYGVDIPITHVTSEPLLHGIFDLNLTGNFRMLADRVYLVQELRYSDTGKYTAFSEGANDRYPTYIYEWIIQGDPNKLWTVTTPTEGGLKRVDIPPIIFTKVAISFLALYHTDYARELSIYLADKTATIYGFREGIDETGRIVGVLTDKTNSMIINAAKYALIKKYQYNLQITVYDWDGVKPIVNARVYVNNIVGLTDVNGTASFSGLYGNVSIYVEYMGINVTDIMILNVVNDTSLVIRARIYDIDFYVVCGTVDEVLVNANLSLYIDGNVVYSGISDINGLVRVEDIPSHDFIIHIFAGNSALIIYSGLVTIETDEQKIFIFVEYSYALIEIDTDIVYIEG